MLDKIREIECDDLAMWISYFRDRKVYVKMILCGKTLRKSIRKDQFVGGVELYDE